MPPQFIRLAILLTFLVLVGTLGFFLTEGWSALECLYMAVITLTTVGFREVRPLSEAGMVFVIGYLIVGIGVFFYGIVEITILIKAEIGDWLERRRMHNKLKTIRDHLIVRP